MTIFHRSHLAIIMSSIRPVPAKKRSGKYISIYLILLLLMMTSNPGRNADFLVWCFSSVPSTTTMHSILSGYPIPSLSHQKLHVHFQFDDHHRETFGEDPVPPDKTKSSFNDDKNLVSDNNTRTGYRRIEDWHIETRDPSHVIKHLKLERAKWAKTFEDLGGDGI